MGDTKDPEETKQESAAGEAGLAQVTALARQQRYREALALARRMQAAAPEDDRLASLIVELRVLGHWSMLAMWPINRFGWKGAVALMAGAVVLMQAARTLGGTTASALVSAFVLAYLAYTWVWPGMLRKLLG